MLHLIGPHNQHEYLHQLGSMHRLRKRIFKDQLKWSHNDIKVISGMEFDQFDIADAFYLVRILENGEVDACTRLLPTSGPYLLGDVYPHLIQKISRPCSAQVWETSRFCADNFTAPKNIVGILVAGMIEFGIKRKISNYVSISDIRIELILRRYGWNPERVGEPYDTGTDLAAAERFEVSETVLQNVKDKAGLTSDQIISNINELDHTSRIAA